jgi:phosphopantothenoylcysteine decarboxylase / phosphopantothenate---cysteine ligase
MQHILLGVTGGISAYKSVELVRRLKEAGSIVRVVMTEAAKAFVTPLSFQAVSEESVYDQLLDDKAEQAMNHITLARWADQVVIAPASADFIARLAHGHANDLLTTLCLATPAPLILAPAMNRFMWENAATQNNVEILRNRNIHFIGPDVGAQACGDIGLGRMVEPLQIIEQLTFLTKNPILQNKHILITAGPTHEPIDPVRYISNKSSGKMGYALAFAALAAGAHVTLISGPVALPPPVAANCTLVETAEEMYAHVMKNLPKTDIFIAAAAVADYHIETVSKEKIKKTSDHINLHLIKNPDILASVAGLPHPPFTVGFAAETQQMLKSARKKLADKKVDLILANDVRHANAGFNVDMNAITAIWKDGEQEFPLTKKTLLAKYLIELIAERYYEKNPT